MLFVTLFTQKLCSFNILSPFFKISFYSRLAILKLTKAPHLKISLTTLTYHGEQGHLKLWGSFRKNVPNMFNCMFTLQPANVCA